MSRIANLAAVCFGLLGLGGRAALADATASVVVTGTSTPVHLETLSADIHVVASSSGRILLSASDARAVSLVARGGRLEAEFDGSGRLRSGDVRLEVPRGTPLELQTLSGDVVIRGAIGSLKLRSVSGDLSADEAAGVEVQTVSGDVVLRRAAGNVKARTVSGDLTLTMNDVPPPTVTFETTSGDLRLSALCGKGCRLVTASVSGDVELKLDRASSFELRLLSHSGDLDDDLHTAVTRTTHGDAPGGAVKAHYGQGEGSIDCRSFSGDVQLRPR